MKKTMGGILCATFLLGTVTSSFGIHAEIPAETSAVVAKGNVYLCIDGNIRTRGFQQGDTASGDTDFDLSGYDGRARLGAKVKVGDEVSGYIRMETGDSSSDSYGWGSGGLWTGGSKNDNDMEILEGWLMYAPGNYGVKVGHMPLAHSNRLFFDHTGSGDDAIFAYMVPSITYNIFRTFERHGDLVMVNW